MEDIKEQDSEAEAQHQPQSAVAKPIPKPVGPEKTLSRKITEARTKAFSLKNEMKRLKGSKDVLTMKHQAMPRGGSGGSLSSDGYKLYHLVIVAIIAMLIGAYI